MSEITMKLSALLKANPGAPFLFVGSGFSRRYIGLEQWSELLKRFCEGINDFGYYSSQSNGDLSKAASAIASDFHEHWWKSEMYLKSREQNKALITSQSSALKLEISRYLSKKALDAISGEHLQNELGALPALNVDGIITTNWDLFLEELFPDYKVFVGQEELLFSNPQSIAEIYKIHGCASKPESLILTHEDYQDYESKNAYLAAKLITIFIEHPVIFIGYSLADRNIQSIISSIARCVGQDKLDQFGKNLVFVQRCQPGFVSEMLPSIINIGDTNLNITVIKTNNFMDVYSAIESTKRKIPARILRYCKEQMYDLVKTTEPSVKLSVVDIDQIESKEDIEFVVGVGVADLQEKFSKKGYTVIGVEEIFADIVAEKSAYDHDQMLANLYPTLLKRSNRYLPAYRYLRSAGINSLADLKASKHEKIEEVIAKSASTATPAYKSTFASSYKGRSTSDIISMCTAEKAAILIPHQNPSEVELPVLEKFLRDNIHKVKYGKSSYSSYFRKAVCFYDKLKYGF